MDLHRSGRKPDWEYVSVASRNGWQRLAARTRGLLTPSNVLTLAGLVLTGFGLYHIATGRMLQGVIELALGGLADIADGWTAARTSTKSPLGKILDAAADKLALGATLIVLAVIGVVPAVAACIVGIQSVWSATLALAGRRKGRDMQVSLYGKRMMLLQRLAVGAFALAALVADGNALHAVTLAIGYALTGASVPFAMKAIAGYMRDLKG